MTESKSAAQYNQKLSKNLLVNAAAVVRVLLDRNVPLHPTPEIDPLDELRDY